MSAPDEGHVGVGAGPAGVGAGGSAQGDSGVGVGPADSATGASAAGSSPPPTRRGSLPDIGFRMPGGVVRILLAAVGVGLCLIGIPLGFWFVVGLTLTALALAAPPLLGAWGLIVLLALATLTRPETAFDVRFFVLLAGIHLLHVLGAQTLVLPLRAWAQVAVLRAPLLRFVVVQVPVQILAFVVLLLAAPGGPSATVPIAAVVGAMALGAVVLVLIVPLLRERPRS
ncbi:MAG: hypothetical protein JWQ64_2585 [Subtercola sp.]|nr:hypothetical protein [Subtercola sp.]